MNLEALGNIGDFVGGIAVVVTLIYLAFQIRQSTKHVEQSLQVSRAQAIRDTYSVSWALEAARDPQLANLYAKGMAHPEQLNSEEQVRFLFFIGSFFGEIEKHQLMHGQGLLTDERWNAQFRTLRIHLLQAGGRYYWKRFRSVHTEAFAQIVEQAIREVGSQSPAA